MLTWLNPSSKTRSVHDLSTSSKANRLGKDPEKRVTYTYPRNVEVPQYQMTGDSPNKYGRPPTRSQSGDKSPESSIYAADEAFLSLGTISRARQHYIGERLKFVKDYERVLL